jgi:hypothetical protein
MYLSSFTLLGVVIARTWLLPGNLSQMLLPTRRMYWLFQRRWGDIRLRLPKLMPRLKVTLLRNTEFRLTLNLNVFFPLGSCVDLSSLSSRGKG